MFWSESIGVMEKGGEKKRGQVENTIITLEPSNDQGSMFPQTRGTFSIMSDHCAVAIGGRVVMMGGEGRRGAS